MPVLEISTWAASDCMPAVTVDDMIDKLRSYVRTYTHVHKSLDNGLDNEKRTKKQ